MKLNYIIITAEIIGHVRIKSDFSWLEQSEGVSLHQKVNNGPNLVYFIMQHSAKGAAK